MCMTGGSPSWLADTVLQVQKTDIISCAGVHKFSKNLGGTSKL
jgi:hypothetical protein